MTVENSTVKTVDAAAGGRGSVMEWAVRVMDTNTCESAATMVVSVVGRI